MHTARQEHPNRSVLIQGAALVGVLSCLLVCNACSGFSTPASASSSSTGTSTNSNHGLTVSGTLPSAVVGSVYSATLTVTGGAAPYAFSLTSGKLPTGVQLGSTTGSFSGTPSTAGSYSFAISVSDAVGASQQQSLQITVASAPITTGANSFSNLQQSSGWADYGQGPPDFVDCSPSPCDGITYSMQQGVKSPSMSGSAVQFNLSGTAVYSDALFNNHLIGAFSSQGMPDPNQTLVPTYHNFNLRRIFLRHQP